MCGLTKRKWPDTSYLVLAMKSCERQELNTKLNSVVCGKFLRYHSLSDITELFVCVSVYLCVWYWSNSFRVPGPLRGFFFIEVTLTDWMRAPWLSLVCLLCSNNQWQIHTQAAGEYLTVKWMRSSSPSAPSLCVYVIVIKTHIGLRLSHCTIRKH